MGSASPRNKSVGGPWRGSGYPGEKELYNGGDSTWRMGVERLTDLDGSAADLLAQQVTLPLRPSTPSSSKLKS